jgi:hypothetical protein
MEGMALAALPLAKVALAPVDRPLRVGILGLGKRGSALLAACGSANVRVVALCDRDPAALRGVPCSLGDSGRFRAAGELVREDGAEALVIAIGDGITWARRAMEAGKHVLLAAPQKCSPIEALQLAKVAEAQRVRFGLAPEDLSWDVDELDGILRSAGAWDPGPVRLAIHSGATGGLDLMHNAARLLDGQMPQSVSRMRASTPLGGSWSARFRFPDGRAIDLHAQEFPQAPRDFVEIRADFRASMRRVQMTIQSRVEGHAEGAALHVPALSAFAASTLDPTAGPSAACRAALAALHWSALLAES